MESDNRSIQKLLVVLGINERRMLVPSDEGGRSVPLAELVLVNWDDPSEEHKLPMTVEQARMLETFYLATWGRAHQQSWEAEDAEATQVEPVWAPARDPRDDHDDVDRYPAIAIESLPPDLDLVQSSERFLAACERF